MKKKIYALFGILFFSGLLVILCQSCDKDTFCYLDVTVEDTKDPKLFGDSTAVNPSLLPLDSCAIAVSGGSTLGDTVILPFKANTHSFTFSAPAIFTIYARVREADTVNHRRYHYREGKKSVRLKEGERVSATVTVGGQLIIGRQSDGDHMWNFQVI